MTVEELISVLSEMDQTDLVVIGEHYDSRGNAGSFRAANDSVYAAIVEINGENHHAVVIDALTI